MSTASKFRVSRRDVLGTSALAGASLLLGGAGRARGERPNLVVICSDQQHWQALGCVDPFFQTPAIDALAASAMRWEYAFCSNPQCSPSRATLLTGQAWHSTGILTNVSAEKELLNTPTVGARLRAAGYHTAYFGKWHLGVVGDDAKGFDDWRVAKDDFTTEDGVEFLRSARRLGKPFALFLMYVEPHGIQQVRMGPGTSTKESAPLDSSWELERFEGKPEVHRRYMEKHRVRHLVDRDRSAWERFRIEYRDRVSALDGQVNKIMRVLRYKKLLDETAVFLTSDHGEMDTRHRLVHKGPFMYEHLVRVPLLTHLPAAFGGTGGALTAHYAWSHADLAPTLLDLAGGEEFECDGRSVVPLLRGEELAARDFVVAGFHSKGNWKCPVRMLRTPEHKYIVYVQHGEELYDLRSDPDELVNLAADPEHAELKAGLRARLEVWLEEHDDPFWSIEPSPLEELPEEEGEDDD